MILWSGTSVSLLIYIFLYIFFTRIQMSLGLYKKTVVEISVWPSKSQETWVSFRIFDFVVVSGGDIFKPDAKLFQVLQYEEYFDSNGRRFPLCCCWSEFHQYGQIDQVNIYFRPAQIESVIDPLRKLFTQLFKKYWKYKLGNHKWHYHTIITYNQYDINSFEYME